MAEVSEIRSLLLLTAQCLVDRPNEVSVEEIAQGNAVLLRLQVGPGEVGKVIGKQGRTARCIRTILSAASITSGQKVLLDIVDQA